jgi:hypothetical protein
MTKPGQDVNGIARTEADHHMKCPACGQWFDMRDLGLPLSTGTMVQMMKGLGP